MAGLGRIYLGGFLALGLLLPGAAIADKEPCAHGSDVAAASVGTEPSAEAKPAKQEKVREAKAEKKQQKEHDPLAYHDYIDDL